MFFQTKAYNQSMKIKIGLLHSNKKKSYTPYGVHNPYRETKSINQSI